MIHTCNCHTISCLSRKFRHKPKIFLRMPLLIACSKLWQTFVYLLHFSFLLTNILFLSIWRLLLVHIFLYVMILIVLFLIRFTMTHFLLFLATLNTMFCSVVLTRTTLFLLIGWNLLSCLPIQHHASFLTLNLVMIAFLSILDLLFPWFLPPLTFVLTLWTHTHKHTHTHRINNFSDMLFSSFAPVTATGV